MDSTTRRPSRARWPRPGAALLAVGMLAGATVLAAPAAHGAPIAGRRRAASSGAAATATSAATSSWLTAVGRDLMGRSPTAAVRAAWVGVLQTGTTRGQMTDMVSRNDFALDLTIRAAYARIVGRPPTSDRSNTWLYDLRRGRQANDLIVGLYGSSELYQKVGGTPAAITDYLYLTILGRPPSAALRAAFIRLLDAGLPRADLANHLWRAPEGAARRVDAAFAVLEGHAPSASSRTVWTKRLTLADDRVLQAAIAASADYVNRAPGRAARLYLADLPLTVGTAGTAYRNTLHASGGTPPYTFSVDRLPTGLAFSGSTITGTPTAARSAFVTLGVRDAAGHRTSRRVALTIVGPALSKVALFNPAASGVDTGVLTRDGADSYKLTWSGTSLTATAAPGNRGSNLRMVVVPKASPAVVASESCATWTSASSNGVQQGVTLQVRAGTDQRIRALTVTKNIAFGSYWVFNLMTFDTSRTLPWKAFGQIGLARTFLDGPVLARLPWQLCARVHGGYLEFKAWRSTEPEPAWGDPLHGGRAPIPAGWNAAGRAGWYIGHLHPGQTARYDGLATWRLTDPADATAPAPSGSRTADLRVGAGSDALDVYTSG